MDDEFVKLDAYYVNLARASIVDAIKDLASAQNSLMRANGDQSEMLFKDIQKRINGLHNTHSWLGVLLINGCSEEK